MKGINTFKQISEIELLEIDGGGWFAVGVSVVVTTAGIISAAATAPVTVPTIVAVATIVSITGGTASTVYTVYDALTNK